MAESTTAVANQTLKLFSGFRGEASIPGYPPVPFDEPVEDGGTATGPSPVDYLLTAVGSCLLSSLSFCLQKKRLAASLEARAEARMDRDEAGSYRVTRIDVHFLVGVREAEWKKVEGCFGVFRKYCTVSASVARGIPVETTLERVEP